MRQNNDGSDCTPLGSTAAPKGVISVVHGNFNEHEMAEAEAMLHRLNAKVTGIAPAAKLKMYAVELAFVIREIRAWDNLFVVPEGHDKYRAGMA